MWISKYLCLFMLYSFLGWIYETTFCTIKNGKWENRGFLYGPICPIYGTGAIAIIVIINMSGGKNFTLNMWQIFIISVVGSAILEYVTSWVLEKLFHAVWWDYLDYPFNLHGRISLFTSLGFGAAGLLIVYILKPFTDKMMGYISPLMTEFAALILLALLMVDLTLTIIALIHFDKFIIQINDTFNKNMGILVDNAVQKTEFVKQSLNSGQKRASKFSNFTKATIKRIYKFKYTKKE